MCLAQFTKSEEFIILIKNGGVLGFDFQSYLLHSAGRAPTL